MARTVFFFLGLGTFHAHTIRPDDLTVLMAADAVRKGSVKTTDMPPGKVGWVESRDSSASLGVLVHWTSQSKPEQGSPSAYCQAVRDFDVHKFAALHWNSNL